MISDTLLVVISLVLLSMATQVVAQRNASCTVNDCNWQTAVDLRANSTVEIHFGDNLDYHYTPACIRILSNTTVVFKGSFVSHPMVAGTVFSSLDFSEDNTSFIATVNTGDSYEVQASSEFEVGAYPYVCIAHYLDGMVGAIWVEEENSEEDWSAVCGSPYIPVASPVEDNLPQPPVAVPATQITAGGNFVKMSAIVVLLTAVVFML